MRVRILGPFRVGSAGDDLGAFDLTSMVSGRRTILSMPCERLP